MKAINNWTNWRYREYNLWNIVSDPKIRYENILIYL